MKRTMLFAALLLATATLFAQKKSTTSATIIFDATTSKDALPKAENKTAIAAINLKTGAIGFETIIKSFNFTNPTIQEHFNGEKWMNSDLYPTATFNGTIINWASVNANKNGTYPVKVEGTLNLHGKTQPVSTTGTLVIDDKTITATADFNISLADYNISGAAINVGKVAAEPKISVVAILK